MDSRLAGASILVLNPTSTPTVVGGSSSIDSSLKDLGSIGEDMVLDGSGASSNSGGANTNDAAAIGRANGGGSISKAFSMRNLTDRRLETVEVRTTSFYICVNRERFLPLTSSNVEIPQKNLTYFHLS